MTEGTINYDVRFDAIAPASEGSTAQKDVIRLIINVEAQTAFNPGYPLTKRAIYYCSRMISAQHGPIFTNSEYGKIRKVYSIWVCTHPTKEFQNTLIRYSIRPEQLIGNAVEKSENYDLMSVVTICLGEPGTENYPVHQVLIAKGQCVIPVGLRHAKIHKPFAEAMIQLGQQLFLALAGQVGLVYKHKGGHMVAPQQPPERFGVTLHSIGTADHQHPKPAECARSRWKNPHGRGCPAG